MPGPATVTPPYGVTRKVTGQATQVGSGQSPPQGAQGNPGPDEVECQRLVPEYQAPNFNER